MLAISDLSVIQSQTDLHAQRNNVPWYSQAYCIKGMLSAMDTSQVHVVVVFYILLFHFFILFGSVARFSSGHVQPSILRSLQTWSVIYIYLFNFTGTARSPQMLEVCYLTMLTLKPSFTIISHFSFMVACMINVKLD